MRYTKRLLLALVALTLVSMAAPAGAEERIIRFIYPYTPPPALTETCYTVSGHWAWDGSAFSWVPSRTV